MNQKRVDRKVIEQLKALQKHTGKNLFEDLFRLFQQQAPTHIQEIERHLGNNDLERVANLAHTLKSSSGNVGACLISDLCSRIEELIVDKEVTDAMLIRPLVEEIKLNLAGTIDEIKVA